MLTVFHFDGQAAHFNEPFFLRDDFSMQPGPKVEPADGRTCHAVFHTEDTVLEQEPSFMDGVSAKAVVTGNNLCSLILEDGGPCPTTYTEPAPHLTGVKIFTI